MADAAAQGAHSSFTLCSAIHKGLQVQAGRNIVHQQLVHQQLVLAGDFLQEMA